MAKDQNPQQPEPQPEPLVSEAVAAQCAACPDISQLANAIELVAENCGILADELKKSLVQVAQREIRNGRIYTELWVKLPTGKTVCKSVLYDPEKQTETVSESDVVGPLDGEAPANEDNEPIPEEDT